MGFEGSRSKGNGMIPAVLLEDSPSRGGGWETDEDIVAIAQGRSLNWSGVCEVKIEIRGKG